MRANGGYVLVVDDDENSRLYISRQLQQSELVVLTAEDGQQAIEVLDTTPAIELILLDILMPTLDGFRVLELLKAHPTLRHLPVVVVSSLDDLKSLVRCIELGAEDYLFKPLNPVLLKARVEACLERKRLRDQETAYVKQLQTEKAAAEMANRARSIFLANISHELRTPLNAIIGYSDILQEDLQDLAPSLVPDAEKIRASGKRLLELINDILDISKIEAGKMELYLERFDVASLVADVVHRITPQLDTSGNTFQLDCSPELGTLHADLSKLSQTLLNLLDNANKFTQQGTITLTVRREDEGSGGASADREEAQIAISSLPSLSSSPDPSSYIVFTIADTGIGIDPDHLPYLFQNFYQVDDSATRKYGGTGLGLALSQRFCQMMGGTITVASQLGQGSVFTVRMPVDVIDHQVSMVTLHPEPVPDASELQPPTELLQLPDEAKLVLVIDSDRAMRDQMVQMLNRQGLRVITAWCGEEGLRLARELRPDWILLDMMLPALESWQVLSTLKASANLAEIPVLAIAKANDQQSSFIVGVTEYLTKPTDLSRFARLMTHYPILTAKGDAVTKHSLLIGTETSTRQIVQRLLEKEAWTVTATDSIRIATGAIAQLQPDLILLDLMLPDMQGFAFLADLHARSIEAPIPTIGFTTHDLNRDDREWFNSYLETLLQQTHSSPDKLLLDVCHLLSPHPQVKVCI
ncbi:response regulator [Pantanalinema sp. GBBB05]|uniref:response regulator n=1 Tax=Pantanalinema sp. GBBB05 TaxID=2604139 RepID=UPI001D46FBB5|nr:response regulator [Pantanalinema sp. GBBB05]